MPNLVIDIAKLPEEGKTISGELDASLFDFKNDQVKAAGPLSYELYVQKFESELLLRGWLSAPMEFLCVRTLQRFIQTISVEEAAISLEIVSGEMDVAEALREEVVINFPTYPRCDEGDDPMPCEVDSRYLAVDKPVEDDVKTPPQPDEPNPWADLDQLDKNLNK